MPGKSGAVGHWSGDQRLRSGPVRIAKWIGHQDNNVAEYAALMEALQYAVALQSAETARLFGFRSSGAADDGRV